MSPEERQRRAERDPGQRFLTSKARENIRGSQSARDVEAVERVAESRSLTPTNDSLIGLVRFWASAVLFGAAPPTRVC